jgi:hypothetical protein
LPRSSSPLYGWLDLLLAGARVLGNTTSIVGNSLDKHKANMTRFSREAGCNLHGVRCQALELGAPLTSSKSTESARCECTADPTNTEAGR